MRLLRAVPSLVFLAALAKCLVDPKIAVPAGAGVAAANACYRAAM